MSDTPTPTCQHCGAGHCGSAIDQTGKYVWFTCSTITFNGKGTPSSECRERAARQKAEAERDEMEARAMGLVLHLPDDITCGEIRRWRDEAKAKLAALAATQNLAADQTVRLAKLATELAETRKELTAINRRLSGEDSEDCVLCAKIGMDGTSQPVPMCRVCQLESDRDRALAQRDETRKELEKLTRIAWGAVHNARRDRQGRLCERWVAVRDAIGVGSQTARDLCRKFGLDPNEGTPEAKAEKGGAS